MPPVSSVGLVDLVVVALVVLSVVGALRRRAGILGALGSGIGTLVLLWVVAVGVAAWAPQTPADLAARSTLVRSVPFPQQAVDQVDTLLGSHSQRF